MQSISIKALNYIAKNSKQQLYYWTTPTDFLTQKKHQLSATEILLNLLWESSD